MQPYIEQDSSNPLEKSAEETHSFDNLNVPMVNDKERNENSKSHQANKGESEKLISHKGSGFLSTPAEDRSNILGTKVLEGRVFYWMHISFISCEISIVNSIIFLINCNCVLFFTFVLMGKPLPINKSSLFSYKSHSNNYFRIFFKLAQKKIFFLSKGITKTIDGLTNICSICNIK